MIKPTTLPGMMELLPKEQMTFDTIKNIIEGTFKKYAFLPIDTPAMEKLEILLAKGGGETSKQVYEIANTKKDIGLRFDLTVPLAKYVAAYFSELDLPFRRYHIGKVYRGERNQKGRYREFYQCDVDIIGHNELSIYNDAEIISCMAEIFDQLKLSYIFKFNNRKILNGYFKHCNVMDFEQVLRTIDKIDKIGEDAVMEMLIKTPMSPENAQKILTFIQLKGTNQEIIQNLKDLKIEEPLFQEGLEELTVVYEAMLKLGISQENIQIDLSITRGLDYYTGSVFETFIVDHENIGSICSGGRYDNLASNYTNQKLPGVGMSIGLTRLFYVLQEENLIRIDTKSSCDIVIIPMEGYEDYSFELLQLLRQHDIRVISYVENGKMKKKFNFADKIGASYVIIIGESEVQSGKFALKNMKTGVQTECTINEIIEQINRDNDKSK